MRFFSIGPSVPGFDPGEDVRPGGRIEGSAGGFFQFGLESFEGAFQIC